MYTITNLPFSARNYCKIMLREGFELMSFNIITHLITTRLNVVTCFYYEELLSIYCTDVECAPTASILYYVAWIWIQET